MTVDAYVTIWLGIAATFIAAIVNFVAGYFRSRAEHRRELAKLAKELALADLADARARNEVDKSHIVRPTSSYVWFYYWFLRRIDKKPFDISIIDTHLSEYGKLLDVYEKNKSHQLKGTQTQQQSKSNDAGAT